VYAARVPPLDALQQGRSAGGRGSGTLMGGLIVAQVALSLVLLTAAGVFARTLNRLANVPLGFDPNGLAVMTVNASRAAGDGAARLRLYERILEAAAAVPEVARAAGSMWTPFSGAGGALLTDARGRRADIGGQVAFNAVTPGWFETYRTGFRAGRDFDSRDSAGAARVAIVNEALRRRTLGDGVAIGTTIDTGPCGSGGCVVIGVVEDALYGQSLRDQPPPTIYVPFAQSAGLGSADRPFQVSIRAGATATRLASTLTESVRTIDPAVTMTLRSLDRDVRASLAQERLLASVAAFFGVLALLLSAIGLYGVTSSAVARRRGEIAIRLALGGHRVAIVRALLTRISALVLIGTATGVLGALWLARFIAPLLYGLEPRDPATLAGSTLILAGIAAIATLLPAWRGTGVEPAQVLRRH
jgi:putative ABC transport system permease protein